MYENHFSFKYKPFDLVPNPDFLFLSTSHKKAITYLDYGIRDKIGFILLTGEIGSGKTTIIRNMVKNLNGAYKLSKVTNTKVSSEQLISMINEDFGLDIRGKDKTTLLSELNEFLIEQYAKGFQPILLIDEGQNLTPDLLEEIRLLTNLETDKAKLLQIILVGQPELKKTLMLPELVQLRQRITINYHITPLTIDETAKYITHRLTIAGNPNVIKFKGDMLDLIYQFSRGIPRLINILCDFTLLATFTDGKKEVSIDTVREVVNDLNSYDYWNESLDIVSGMKRNFGGAESLRVTDEIVLRLAKLEDAVSQIIRSIPMEVKSLSEKVARFEKGVFKANTDRSDDKMAELLERVSRLEKMPIVAKTDKTPGSLELGDDKPLSEQVEFLKRMINYLNYKIRKL